MGAITLEECTASVSSRQDGGGAFDQNVGTNVTNYTKALFYAGLFHAFLI
jgi:hypothetical protein